MLPDIVGWGSFALITYAVLGLPALYSFKRWRAVRKAAELCGLEVEKASRLPVLPRLLARSGPLEVRIRMVKDNKIKIVAAVDGPPEVAQLVIRRELLKLPGTRDLATGDEEFDDELVVQGPLPFLCALLDASTRRKLLQANANPLAMEVRLADGELRTEVDENRLPGVVALFQDLGQKLAGNVDDIPRRLLANVRSDSKPGVRLLNLLTLIREYPGDPSTDKALRVGCNDKDPEIRLRAALELGAGGEETLLKLARGSDDDAISAQAVTGLGRSLSLEAALALLARAEKQRLSGTARACLEVLGSLGGVAVEALAEVMARDNFELAAAAARGLGATGAPAAEPPLLAALERDNPELQAAAAEALGRVGSVAAVPPLLDLAESPAAPYELRQAARQGVAEIQSRLDGASPGQLSLAAADAGQLSLAPHEAGQLSLAPERAGQLSPPPRQAH